MEVNKLEELYDGLHINSTHYLGNALSMTVFGTNYAFSKLREKVSTRFFDCLAHPNLSATLATDQKWPFFKESYKDNF